MPLGIALSIDRTDLATISQSLPLATTGSSDVAAISSPGAAATTDGVAALLALFDRAFALGSSFTVVVAPEEEFDSSAVLVRGRFNPRCGAAAVTAGVVAGVAVTWAEGGAAPAGESTGAVVVALASIALGVGAAMGVKLTGIAVAIYDARLLFLSPETIYQTV